MVHEILKTFDTRDCLHTLIAPKFGRKKINRCKSRGRAPMPMPHSWRHTKIPLYTVLLMCSVSGVDLNHSTYSVRRFQQSPYSGNLINQRDTRQERIRRRPRRFRKVRAVEGVGVVEILNPILHGGHVSLN